MAQCTRCGAPLTKGSVEETIRMELSPQAVQLPETVDISLPVAASWGSIIARFRSERNSGRTPRIEEFVQEITDRRLELQTELIHIEFEHRLENDKQVRIEEYFQRFPDILQDPGLAARLIAGEFHLRQRHGVAEPIDDFLRRFPNLQDRLREVLDDPSPKPAGDSSKRVPCPHCRQSVTLGPGESTVKVHCPHCQGRFSIDSAETETWSMEGGPRVGKYELIRCIGQGAFGTVHLARDTELDRCVAIKVPRSGTFLSAEDEEKFVREARNAARLHHRHIVQVFDAGHSGEFPFIVTEFVSGGTLQVWMKSHRFAHREAAKLVATLAEAVHYAHEQGVIHRDLKPANVMIDSNGEPRIMDFGLAKREQPEVTVTMEGQVLGTPAYMSPEQARGDSNLADARADVYSLGVMLFELLTGERPFRGNSTMLLNAVIHVDPPSPRSLDQLISRDLETIGLKCLQKAPDRRYQTAGDLAADLRRHLRNEPILARPISIPERGWRWCQRNRSVAISATAVLVTLVTALSIVAGFWQAERRAKEAANQLADENAGLLVSERQAHQNAIASRQQALRRLRDARRAVDTSLTEFSHALRLFPGVGEARARVLFKAAEDYQRFAQEHADDPDLELERSRALVRLALVKRELHEQEEASRVLEAAIKTLQELATKRPTDDAVLVELANAHAQRGLLYASENNAESAQMDYQAAETTLRPLLTKSQIAEPTLDSLATLLVDSAVLLVQIGQVERAAEIAQRAVDAFGQLQNLAASVSRYRLGLATAQDVLGQTLFQRGRLDEALTSYRNAINTLDALVQQDADNADYFQTRAEAKLRLAAAQRAQGRIYDELQSLAQSVEDFEVLTKSRPDVPAYEDNLAVGWIDLGIVYLDQGATQRARESLEKAEQVCAKLAHRFPEEAIYLEHQAACWSALGNVFNDLNEGTKAATLLEKSVKQYEELSQALPTVVEYRERAAIAATHFGRHLHQSGDFERAIPYLEKARGALKELSDEAPNVVAYRDAAAHAAYRLALALRDAKQPDKAKQALQEARDGWNGVVGGDEPAPEYAASFAKLLIECPDPAFRDEKLARQLAQRVRNAVLQNPFYVSLLGHTLCRSQEWKKAIETLNEAESLHGSDIARDHFYRAIALSRDAQPDLAQQFLQRGLEAMERTQPGNADLKWLRDDAVSQVKAEAVSAN